MRTGSDRKLKTATEIAIALGISHARFFSFDPVPVRRVQRSYGSVLGFSVESLPEELRALLRYRRRRNTFSAADFISFEIQRRRRPVIGELLKRRRTPTLGPKVDVMREVLNRYIWHLDNGMSEAQSNVRARSHFLRLVRRDSINERQIRRRAERIIEAGGPELAPIDAYDADGSKSVQRKPGRRSR